MWFTLKRKPKFEELAQAGLRGVGDGHADVEDDLPAQESRPILEPRPSAGDKAAALLDPDVMAMALAMDTLWAGDLGEDACTDEGQQP